MGMLLLSMAAVLSAGGSAFAGEFPDDWTWDDKPDVRAEHAALEGKPMPKVNLTGWINGTITPRISRGKW